MNLSFWLTLSLSLIVIFQLIIATTPIPPCDEKIEDKGVYENIVLSNDIIKQINNELELYEIRVGDCFVNGRVDIDLYYKFPSDFSSYGILFSDDLIISYFKNGSIMMGYYGRDGILGHDKVIDAFKNNIAEIESNPRIQEFIFFMNPKTFPLIDTNARISSQHSYVEYSQYRKSVRGYSLPNSIDWDQFPEIKEAHEIIEKNLLINELANCSIGKDDFHSYTIARFHDSKDNPWYLTVALICDDGWKDAFVQLNPDGTYERLHIDMDYSTIQGTKIPPITQYYGIFLFFAIVFLGIVLLLIKRKH